MCTIRIVGTCSWYVPMGIIYSYVFLSSRILHVYNLFRWQMICSYVFYPIAYFMGTDVSDCRKVAELVGIKTFTNEFLAYKELSILIGNKKNFTEYTAQWNSSTDWYYQGDDIVLQYVNQTLKKGIISVKIIRFASLLQIW